MEVPTVVPYSFDTAAALLRSSSSPTRPCITVVAPPAASWRRMPIPMPVLLPVHQEADGKRAEVEAKGGKRQRRQAASGRGACDAQGPACAHWDSLNMLFVTCDQGHAPLEQLVQLLSRHPACLACPRPVCCCCCGESSCL